MSETKKIKQHLHGGGFVETRIIGNGSIVFEDGGGVEILEYEDATLLIGAGKTKIRIFGSNFELDKISPNLVSVSGILQSVEFES